MSLLSLRGVSRSYGGVVANDAITFDVPQGALHAVIGPNGAGKTTLFNLIAGFQSPTAGSVIFDGRPITGLPPHKIARLGLIRTFQLVKIFQELTPRENVQVGLHLRTAGGIGSAISRSRAMRRQEAWVAAEADQALGFVGLDGLGDAGVDRLTYGQLRLLELARALACGPRLLLLDEPAAGLNRRETDALGEVIQRIHQRGITILLIEHDMTLVMTIAERVTVLDFGRKIAEGPPGAVTNHPDVIAAYLGSGGAVHA